MFKKPQFGEQKIIKGLFPPRFFVDIGAGLRWSNTDFLLLSGWKGIQLDREDGNLVTVDNVNEFLEDAPEVFDFLSIDIDGNDYWIWKAIIKKARVVCIEFNSHRNDVMPYQANYEWDGRSNDYGASKESLIELGKELGYEFINESGDNLFFKL